MLNQNNASNTIKIKIQLHPRRRNNWSESVRVSTTVFKHENPRVPLPMAIHAQINHKKVCVCVCVCEREKKICVKV
jgi:hypothetical protein